MSQVTKKKASAAEKDISHFSFFLSLSSEPWLCSYPLESAAEQTADLCQDTDSRDLPQKDRNRQLVREILQ